MFGFKIIVTGDYACFTRPELKVERVSYDVPTPCALEGLLKSIYWKPAIKYCIDKIIVFNPIRFMNVRRNEVSEKVDLSKVQKSMINKVATEVITSKCISQRNTMLLKNVCYGIEFHFEMTGIQSDNEDECEEKHYNIIKRRLENGQCFRQPHLGCKEFPVQKIQLVDCFDTDAISHEIMNSGDVDLGYMLHHLNFHDNGIPINGNWDTPVFSDKADAVFYRPHMINGIIDVTKYEEVM